MRSSFEVAFKRDFKDGKWPFGGEGEPDSEPLPTGDACVKISEILALVDERAGEYSFGGLADTLPSMPGLFVKDVGVISLPLAPEQAQKLITKCEKSPFGHNTSTKMDENVRRSWQLSPDQLEIKHPWWEAGIEKLTEVIASRLGYKGVPLQCVLYKLLVYGEGGHFVKHQDTEKEDGMIATLVVQPPSVHDGGDLVVYRNGVVEHRHDFGKATDTAAYFSHYAVHYADAEHAVEKATNGYRLALVYSICLPVTMRHLERDPNMSMADELAEVINGMGSEDASFALLLSHEYTKKSIEDMGSGALKGIDSARFQVLEGANSLIFDDKKRRFFIVKLAVKIDNRLDDQGWGDWGREQALHWYSIDGQDLGHWKDEIFAKKLNFLNPGHETLRQLWKSYGKSEDVYTGNEGPIKSTKYARFAIVAWPADQHLQNMIKLMSADLAVEELVCHKPVSASSLRDFLDTTSSTYGWGERDRFDRRKASVRFCRSFCTLLVEANWRSCFLHNFVPDSVI